jgi:hypothetical protein
MTCPVRIRLADSSHDQNRTARPLLLGPHVRRVRQLRADDPALHPTKRERFAGTPEARHHPRGSAGLPARRRPHPGGGRHALGGRGRRWRGRRIPRPGAGRPPGGPDHLARPRRPRLPRRRAPGSGRRPLDGGPARAAPALLHVALRDRRLGRHLAADQHAPGRRRQGSPPRGARSPAARGRPGRDQLPDTRAPGRRDRGARGCRRRRRSGCGVWPRPR